MGNSSLVNYTKISPNRTSPRRDVIRKITIHHMAGNGSIEGVGNHFATAGPNVGSSNYGISSDGRIAMYVEEKDAAWTSSSSLNDNQAVTIEVANDGGAPDWHVSDKALAALIDLVTDICERNDIEKLVYTDDAMGNLTRHNMFAATECPGPYLQSQLPRIAREVNKHLDPPFPVSVPSHWAQEAAEWAIKAGIVKGDGDPDGDGLVEYNWQTPVTFERMVTLLHQQHLAQTGDGGAGK